MRIKKISAVLIAVCLMLSCVVTGTAAVQEDVVRTSMEAGGAQMSSNNCAAGGTCLWYWGINGSGGHYKYCGKCGSTKDYEAHGFITVNGVRYCGSCGWVASCSASPYGSHTVTAGSAPFCLYCGQRVL